MRVGKKSRTGGSFTEKDILSLAAKLKKYASTLPDGEMQILSELLLQSMKPLDRFRYLKTSELLDAEEESLLRSIERELTEG